jgi:hypothetical protein
MYLSAFGPTTGSTLGSTQFNMALRAHALILSRLFKPPSTLDFTFDIRFFNFIASLFYLQGFHF